METAERAQIEHRMEMQARSEVLANARWLTALQVAERAGFNTSNPSKQLNQWKSDGIIFSIQHDGVEYYPSYALDEKNGFQPLKIIADLIHLFQEKKSGWGIAFWCSSPNGYLGRKRPQDTLVTDPESVLNAARWEAEGVQHG